MDAFKKFQEATLRRVRNAVSQKKRRLVDSHRGWDLDLSYITPRILAMGYPAIGVEAMYRNPRLGKKGVVAYLDQTHGTHYHVFNVCAEEKYQYEASDFHGRVTLFPFFDHNPAPLFLVAGFCLEAQRWLDAHPENVIVIHCKAGKGRTGFITACLLLHLGAAGNATDAIQLFTEKRVEAGRALNQPSQIAYVKYWDDICQRNHAANKENAMEEFLAGSSSARRPLTLLLPDPKRSELYLRCLSIMHANPDWPKLRIVFYQNGAFLTQRGLRAKHGNTFLIFCNFELAGDVKVVVYSSPGEEEHEELVMEAKHDLDSQQAGDNDSSLTAAARTSAEIVRRATTLPLSRVRSKLLVRYWFNTEFVADYSLEARKAQLDVANVADTTGLFSNQTVMRFGFTHSPTAEFSFDGFLSSSPLSTPASSQSQPSSSVPRREPRPPPPPPTTPTPMPASTPSNSGGGRGSFCRTPQSAPSLTSSVAGLAVSSPPMSPRPPALPTLQLDSPPMSPMGCVSPSCPSSPTSSERRERSASRKRTPKLPVFKLTDEDMAKLPTWSLTPTPTPPVTPHREVGSVTGSVTASDSSVSVTTTHSLLTLPSSHEWDRTRSRSRTASASIQRLNTATRERPPPPPTFRTMPATLPSHNAAAPLSRQVTPLSDATSPKRAQSLPVNPPETPDTTRWTFQEDHSPSSSHNTPFVSCSCVASSSCTDTRTCSPSPSPRPRSSSFDDCKESKGEDELAPQLDFIRLLSEVTPVTGTNDLQEEDDAYDSGDDQGEEGATPGSVLDAPFRHSSPAPPHFFDDSGQDPSRRRQAPPPPPTIYETDGVRRGSTDKTRLRERRRGVTASGRSSLQAPRIPLANLVRFPKDDIDKLVASYRQTLVDERHNEDSVAARSPANA